MSEWNKTYYFPREMLEQPSAIENCLSALSETIDNIVKRAKSVSQVHIVGSGDCYFISITAAESFLKMAGIVAAGYEAYDYYLNKPSVDNNTLVILFSSSGKSVYVLKAAEYANQCGAFTVGVTNHADSELETICKCSLVTIAVGVSKSFPSKTSTSALALMYCMAARLGKIKGFLSDEKSAAFNEELTSSVPALIRRIYETEHQKIIQSAKQFLEARCYIFVGSGPSRTSAMIGAAKITETSRLHVTSCNAEEYMHLHGFSVKCPDAVIIIGNNLFSHRERQVLEYAVQQCAKVLVIGNVDCSGYKNNVVHIADFIENLSAFSVVLPSMVALHLFACELAHLSYKDPDMPHDVDLKHVIGQLYKGPVAGWQK